MLSLNTCLSKVESVPYRIIEKEAILVGVDKGEIHHLNPVGASIWNLIDGKITVGEIIDEIHKKYKVDPETAKKDVLEFAGELLEKGVVECQVGEEK